LRSSVVTDQRPPTALLALAAFARSRRPGAGQEPADGPSGGQVAIVLERAGTPQSTALRLEAYGVTAREREVATLIAQGRSNPEIAEALVLSPYTVQDHIKNLFEKTGVSSRQELVARAFLDDYLPLVAGQTPLTSAGGFGSRL
jgi:DNA-binding CsgD family transcriptional regulator